MEAGDRPVSSGLSRQDGRIQHRQRVGGNHHDDQERPLLRSTQPVPPVANRRRPAAAAATGGLAIVTLGFGEIVRILATIIPALRGNVGFSQLSQPPGQNADGTPLFSNSNGTPWYWLALTIIIIVLLLVGNLERSRVGRAWVAIREDEDAAEIMGVPVFKYKVWAFAIGAAIGGLSGALSAGQTGFINNQGFGVQSSILFLAAVVLGGAGNKVGAIVGGAIVAYIPDRFIAIADYKYLIFGLALIIMMIFRAGGILGARQKLLAYGRIAYRRVGKGDPPVIVPPDSASGPTEGAK